MGVAWNPVAVPALVALATGVAMAAFVYQARLERSQNRRLALLHCLEGPTIGTMVGTALATHLTTARGSLGLIPVGMLLVPAVAYLPSTMKERRELIRLQDDLELDALVVNRPQREVLKAAGGEAT